MDPMWERHHGTGLDRRRFLTRATAAMALLGLPATLRAQTPSVKIGTIHPVTGPLAEPGQACQIGRAHV